MTKSNLSNIDRLGEIKAKIAELKKEEEALRDEIVALGVGTHEGDLFRVSVSITERETLDMAAVREHLSRQFIQAHTNITSVTTVKVVARNGK